MFRKISLLFFSFLLLSFGSTAPVFAEEQLTQIYDTSNHYLGACRLTDKTTWTLDNDLEVKLFQIWYNWDAGETEVGFTLEKDGSEFLSGTVTRSQCDPYQKSWCNGDLKVEKTFSKGTYELKVDKAKQCAIPSGNGTVRLYGVKTEASASEPTLKVTATAVTPTAAPSPTSLPIRSPIIQKCNPDWCYPAVGFLVFSNLLTLIFFLRKK